MPISTTSPLKTPAREALQKSAVPALRQIMVEETNDHLILKGRLPSYYYKQLAQETVVPHLQGRTLLNQIVVNAKG